MKVKVPAGEKVTISHGKLQVPDHPIIAFIEGDGTGPDIWHASVRVLDAAVAQAYKGRRKIAWVETYAGEKAQAVYGTDCPPNLLPQETSRSENSRLASAYPHFMNMPSVYFWMFPLCTRVTFRRLYSMA